MSIKAGKYTAQEIVEAAGFAAEDIGSVRCVIGGIRGINDKSKVINALEGQISVVVGENATDLTVIASEEPIVSEGARNALDAEGRDATAQSEALRAERAAAAEADPEAESDGQAEE